MAGYQVETFQCTSVIHAQQIMRDRSVAIHLLAPSFFISCVKCLWEVVGNFLGPRAEVQGAHPAGCCGDPALLGVSATCNHFK